MPPVQNSEQSESKKNDETHSDSKKPTDTKKIAPQKTIVKKNPPQKRHKKRNEASADYSTELKSGTLKKEVRKAGIPRSSKDVPEELRLQHSAYMAPRFKLMREYVSSRNGETITLEDV